MQNPHTGAMRYDTTVTKIPAAALSVEDAAMLHRMYDRGERVVVTLKMEARTHPDAMSRNVVAELVGREKPDEIVVLGGHIDSWDVGQGAMDDGGGSVAAWEAVRLLKRLGLRPRRTLRVVLWTNEENGLRGATAYRDAHAAEIPRHVMAMESDAGVFAPRGFSVDGSPEAVAMMSGLAPLLESIGATLEGLLPADPENSILKRPSPGEAEPDPEAPSAEPPPAEAPATEQPPAEAPAETAPEAVPQDEAPIVAPEEGPAEVIPDEAPDESAPPAE